jgi:hypothetical protein
VRKDTEKGGIFAPEITGKVEKAEVKNIMVMKYDNIIIQIK